MSRVPQPTQTTDRGRIPGPRGLELWRFLARFQDRPYRRLLNLALEYGDIVMLDFTNERVVLLAKPEYVEQVLSHHHHHYDKQTSRWESVRQILGYGLLTSDGDVWRRQRQRMQPAFHHDALKGFAGMVVEEAERVASVWNAAAARGESRNVLRDMLNCALRAITRATFGSGLDGKEIAIIQALETVNNYVNPMSTLNLLRVPVSLQRLINPGHRRFKRAYDVIDQALAEIVTKRLSEEPDRRDLLGMIMHARDEESAEAMTPTQLHDEMVNVLMAGHETTGISTAWCWYWLSQYPEVERQLHAELDRVLGGRPPAIADLPNLPYTRMVFDETLRISPPVWAFDRRAKEEDWIDGYRIKRDTKMAISPYLLHHHPKYWDEPETFRPERFTPEAVAARPQYAYFPFGGGPRRCVGVRFALLEGQLILATLAQAFSARLKPGHEVVPEARLNLPPRFGLPMFLEPRRAATATHPSSVVAVH